MVRVRSADGEPVLLERSWLPLAVFPGLLRQALDGSLYTVLEQVYGRPPVRARETLMPLRPSAAEAATLDLPEGDPALLVERTAYDAEGTAVEFARDLLRADRARVVVWSSPLGGRG